MAGKILHWEGIHECLDCGYDKAFKDFPALKTSYTRRSRPGRPKARGNFHHARQCPAYYRLQHHARQEPGRQGARGDRDLPGHLFVGGNKNNMSKKTGGGGQPGTLTRVRWELSPGPMPFCRGRTRPASPALWPARPGKSAGPAVSGEPGAGSGLPDHSGKYFLILWVVILLAAAAAWTCRDLPGVSESIIERWMMAALASLLAVFFSFINKSEARSPPCLSS